MYINISSRSVIPSQPHAHLKSIKGKLSIRKCIPNAGVYKSLINIMGDNKSFREKLSAAARVVYKVLIS